MIKLDKKEAEMWQHLVFSYINAGHTPSKGSHLRFADNVIKALRKRTFEAKKPNSILIGELLQVKPGHLDLAIFSQYVIDAVKSSAGKHSPKINAIKKLKETCDIGLKEAKTAVEIVMNISIIEPW